MACGAGLRDGALDMPWRAGGVATGWGWTCHGTQDARPHDQRLAHAAASPFVCWLDRSGVRQPGRPRAVAIDRVAGTAAPPSRRREA